MTKARVLIVGAALALVSFIAPLTPAVADSTCYAENYGGGSCGTTCVITDDHTGEVRGWLTHRYAC